MKFIPITEKYKFDDSLKEHYPEYIREPIKSWILYILEKNNLIGQNAPYEPYDLGIAFRNSLQISLREAFPSRLSETLNFIMSESDRTTNFLALCLQNYAQEEQANALENVLARGGSAYRVISTIEKPESWDKGVFTLIKRVPELVVDSVSEAINDETRLKEAWIACYSQNPDYEKTVNKCCDVVEGIIGKNYFPNELKPKLGKFIKDLSNAKDKISYAGDMVIADKFDLYKLLEKFTEYRGIHTSGTGKLPSKDEAEFILHYSIFFWSLHNK